MSVPEGDHVDASIFSEALIQYVMEAVGANPRRLCSGKTMEILVLSGTSMPVDCSTIFA